LSEPLPVRVPTTMKSNQARPFAAICLVIGVCWCGNGDESPARAQSLKAEEPRLVAELRLAPEADIRPQVRELLREVLEGLDGTKDVVIRTERAAACAVVQARMGDAKEARQTLRQAREYVSNMDNLSKENQRRVSDVMRELAKNCADAGDVEELEEVLKALPDPEQVYLKPVETFRDVVTRECAIVFAKAGKRKEALDLAKEHKADTGPEATRITPEVMKFWVLREIALFHARAGEMKEARKTLESIPNAADKVRTMAGTVFSASFELPSEPGIALI
jgi:hypothetical protein